MNSHDIHPLCQPVVTPGRPGIGQGGQPCPQNAQPVGERREFPARLSFGSGALEGFRLRRNAPTAGKEVPA
jgi:hypothetical protein